MLEMSEYTPTVEEARLVWQEWNGYGGLIDRTGPEPTTRADMRDEFDRMIAEVKAQALEEAAEGVVSRVIGIFDNAESTQERIARSLRARAAEIREGK